MKACILARALGSRPTGRAVYARELAEELARRDGVDLTVFTGEPVALAGCRVLPGRGANPAADALRVALGIAADVRRIGPDVFWSATHFLPLGLPRGLPVVITVLDLVWRDHGETMALANRLVASWFERSLFRADAIACISGFTRDRLIHYWPALAPRARVVHLAPGARGPARDAAASAAFVRSRFGLEPGYVLNVGTFEPRKNLSVLLDAAAAMPGHTFAVCGGSGWGVPALRRRAAGLANIRLLGWVEEEALGALFAAAGAAAFPTVYEGFHIPPLDAMREGCPVLASDIPVHREVLGDAAAYFPAHDPAALVSALSRVLESGRGKMEEAGRTRAAQYRWDRSADVLLDIFRDVLRGRREHTGG